MKEYQPGEKIAYRLLDKNGKAHWIKGVIHGVRRYEDPATNMILKVTYLVDTGRDESVTEIVHNPRIRELNIRKLKALKASKLIPGTDDYFTERDKIVERILEQDDLPQDGEEIEAIRQPEQIELPAEFIRPRK